MGFRLVPTSMTLNDLERRNSPYFAFFTEFDIFLGRLYHSGWRQTYNVCKILSPISSLLLLAKTIMHPAARSLCDSWASCWKYHDIFQPCRKDVVLSSRCTCVVWCRCLLVRRKVRRVRRPRRKARRIRAQLSARPTSSWDSRTPATTWLPSCLLRWKSTKTYVAYAVCCRARFGRMFLVLVQVLFRNLSSPTSLRFGLGTFLRTGLSPCVAFALLFLFISCKPHFTSATKKEHRMNILCRWKQHLLDADFMCKTRQIWMRICRVIKFSASYHSYCNSS